MGVRALGQLDVPDQRDEAGMTEQHGALGESGALETLDSCCKGRIKPGSGAKLDAEVFLDEKS